MSTPQQKVEADLKAAMKAGDKERLQTLRLLLTDLKNKRIETGAEVDEAAFFALVQRAIKQRVESAEAFTEGGRDELAAKERREIEILEPYLPEQVSEDEIRRQIEELVAAEGLEGPAAIGAVMKVMLPRLAGSADGGTVSRIAKQVLLGS